MALNGKTNEEKIWNYLCDKIGNEYGAAGCMGNIFCESGLSPTNLENTYEKKLGYSDSEYVTAVDNGLMLILFTMLQVLAWHNGLIGVVKKLSMNMQNQKINLSEIWRCS